jgi:hypothetical protein
MGGRDPRVRPQYNAYRSRDGESSSLHVTLLLAIVAARNEQPFLLETVFRVFRPENRK